DNQGTWTRPYDITVGGFVFDADFLMYPLVSYDLDTDFTASSTCVSAPDTVYFDNLSSPILYSRFYNVNAFAQAWELSHTWDFGDGTPPTNPGLAQDTFHYYGIPGAYTVTKHDTLIGWTNFLCTSSKTVDMNATPLVDFFAIPGLGNTADFFDMTPDNPSAWLWDFGDGNTSSSPSPQHTYAAPGNYMVCLTVTNACGTDSMCQMLNISGCPIPQPTYTYSANLLQVDFFNSTVSHGGVTWAWDFGDGNTSSLQNPSHTYATQGSYQVCLTVTDSCGTDSSCQQIPIGAVNVQEALTASALSVYPNPTSDRATVAIALPTPGDFVLRVSDLMGRKVFEQAWTGTREAEMALDVADLQAGLYLVELQSGTERVVKRLQVSR
ncbi:MAG: PKD domain-containing protein, partial [Bacteroidota bacterium]